MDLFARSRSAARVAHGALIAVLLVAASPAAPGEAAGRGLEPTKSMGQPWRFKPYVGGAFNWDRRGDDQVGGGGFLGVYRDLVNPVTGLLGVAAEGYAGGLSGEWDGGARLLAVSRALALQTGIDWNAPDGRADFILTIAPYFWRGGLLGTGANFRVEWLPTRGHSLRFGIQFPLEPRMGKTRPAKTTAALPPAPSAPEHPVRLPADVEAALAGVREAGLWLVGYANAFDDDDDASYFKAMEGFRRQLARAKARIARVDAGHPEGHRHASEARHYHEDLERAFVAAMGVQAGLRAAQVARAVLLDEVIIPYDRLVGQFKRPDTTRGLGARASEAFARWLAGDEAIGADRRGPARAVFGRLLEVVEEGRKAVVEHWDGDERKGWIPLQLALRPEETRTQAQLDAVIGRVLGRPITLGNASYALGGARFQVELLRSIHSAERYHVLWIHDYAGKINGKPDPVTFAITVEGYLRALTDRVRSFDETGELPMFIVLHGQYYYESNENRLFLSLLEDPLGHTLRLPAGHDEMAARARRAQDELRAAVAASGRLQAEARRRGRRWLRDVVKVHVNVTFPADLSFRSARVIDAVPFAPDSLMTDHRKLAFWDVTEEDPARGGALLSGTGVGSDYGSPSWDDRALLASGPALLELKDAARRLLRSQGFREEEIPAPLRPLPLPPDRAAAVARRVAAGFNLRALAVMNEVGDGRKEATLLQAVLYTLAPPDTIIVSPDSIWTSPFWAGQLVGAALRGCHVYAIAPSLDNAPAASLPIMARTREVFARLVAAANALAPEIAAAGGTLRVGLYTRAAPAGDLGRYAAEIAAGLRRHPFLLDELPMPEGAAAAIDEIPAALTRSGYRPSPISAPTRAGRPKLHRKTQLFASRETLRKLVSRPGVMEAMGRQLATVAKESAASAGELIAAGVSGEILLPAPEPDRGPEWAGAVFYLTVGSKNQDSRGAFLDGEVTWLAAGGHALEWYLDFFALTAATTWIENEEQVTKLLPVEEEKFRKLGRLLDKVL